MSIHTPFARVINPGGDRSSVNAAQYLTLQTVNPIIAADGRLPFVHAGRTGATELIYNFEEDNSSTRLSLSEDGEVISLERWEKDGQFSSETEQATVTSGNWVDLAGTELWESLHIALRGTNLAQQAAIDKMSDLRGGEPSIVTREGESGAGVVTAKWIRSRGPKDDVFVVRVNEAGTVLGVNWTSLAASH